MRSFLPRALLIILVSIAPFFSSAQFKVYQRPMSFRPVDYSKTPRAWQRLHVNYSLATAGAYIDYKYKGRNYYGKTESETIRTKLPGGKGYGFGFGAFFPLVKVGEKSKLCLSVDATINLYDWKSFDGDDENSTANSLWNNDDRSEELAIGLDEIVVPFTLDYKFGCDVMQSKDIRGSFAIGLGACYRNSSGIFYDLNSKNINSVNPVFKLEAGTRIVSALKLRLLYQIGRVNYLNHNVKGDGYEESLNMYSKGNLVISLLVNPTAVAWESDGF